MLSDIPGVECKDIAIVVACNEDFFLAKGSNDDVIDRVGGCRVKVTPNEICYRTWRGDELEIGMSGYCLFRNASRYIDKDSATVRSKVQLVTFVSSFYEPSTWFPVFWREEGRLSNIVFLRQGRQVIPIGLHSRHQLVDGAGRYKMVFIFVAIRGGPVDGPFHAGGMEA
jgi:hypothetical protein